MRFSWAWKQYMYRRELRELDVMGSPVSVILARAVDQSPVQPRKGVVRVVDYNHSLAITSNGQRGTKGCYYFYYYYYDYYLRLRFLMINWSMINQSSSRYWIKNCCLLICYLFRSNKLSFSVVPQNWQTALVGIILLEHFSVLFWLKVDYIVDCGSNVFVYDVLLHRLRTQRHWLYVMQLTV